MPIKLVNEAFILPAVKPVLATLRLGSVCPPLQTIHLSVGRQNLHTLHLLKASQNNNSPSRRGTHEALCSSSHTSVQWRFCRILLDDWWAGEEKHRPSQLADTVWTPLFAHGIGGIPRTQQKKEKSNTSRLQRDFTISKYNHNLQASVLSPPPPSCH